MYRLCSCGIPYEGEDDSLYLVSEVYIFVCIKQGISALVNLHLTCNCTHASPSHPPPLSYIHLRCPRNPRIAIRISPHFHVLFLPFSFGGRLRSLTRLEALLEISNDIIDMFGADGDADEVFCDAGVDALGFGELFVGCGPGVDG